MKNRIFYFSSVVLIFLGFFIFTKHAIAFSVSPSKFDLKLNRGDTKIGFITIKNISTSPVEYSITSQNFISNGENGRLDFIQTNSVFDDVKWIEPESQKILLDSNDTRDLKYTIRIPTDAKIGGHYIALMFARNNSETNADIINSNPKTAVLFYLDVAGNEIENSKIISFNLIDDVTSNRFPLIFETTINNSGNTHIQPKGDIVITNFFGKKIASILLNTNNELIMPNETRRFLNEWKKTNFNNEKIIKSWFSGLYYEFRNFAFGPYTASVSASYGNSAQILQAQIKFWIMPWRIIIVFIILFFFTLAAHLITKRNVRSNLIFKAQKNQK